MQVLQRKMSQLAVGTELCPLVETACGRRRVLMDAYRIVHASNGCWSIRVIEHAGVELDTQEVTKYPDRVLRCGHQVFIAQ